MSKNLIYLITSLFILCTYNVSGQDTFADTFSVVAYNQNNGTQNWATDWIETGDDGSAANTGFFNARSIYINNGNVGLNQKSFLTQCCYVRLV